MEHWLIVAVVEYVVLVTVSVVVVTGKVVVAGALPTVSPPIRVKSGPLKPASRFRSDEDGAHERGGVGHVYIVVVTQLVLIGGADRALWPVGLCGPRCVAGKITMVSVVTEVIVLVTSDAVKELE